MIIWVPDHLGHRGCALAASTPDGQRGFKLRKVEEFFRFFAVEVFSAKTVRALILCLPGKKVETDTDGKLTPLGQVAITGQFRVTRKKLL
jgi:hypothetical protein